MVTGSLWLGCGLLVESLSGVRVPGALLPVCGFGAIIAIGQFLTLGEATAPWTVPAVVVLAACGYAIALLRRRLTLPAAPLVVAAVLIFAVYSAPIVASGEASLAGYIKLDDTATWLAFTDRLMEHGRDLSGLADSTYQRVLQVNIGEGYPVGVFIPLGVGVELVGADGSTLIQPYMALLAVLIGLAAWELLRPAITSVWLRAAGVVVAAQSATLYGYYLWGGVKEVAAAALIASAAALIARLQTPEGQGIRALIPLLIAAAAIVGVLSPGGLIWILLPLVIALVGLVAQSGGRVAAAHAIAFTLGLLLLSLPVLIPGGAKPPTSSPLDDETARGNLIEPLDPLQVGGVWPAADFRLAADAWVASGFLIAIVFALAAWAVLWAWKERAGGLRALAAGGLTGCLVLALAGSPWVEGKAFAIASAFVLILAIAGAGAIGQWAGRTAALAAAGIVAVGVIWSNALAYRGVSLAPTEQFAELEKIGAEIAGEGPTLMTEYSPYGARHFLREGETESISELRSRSISLADGEQAEKGDAADTDEIDPAALGVYRTLVLRRSPVASRPPSAYELTWRGRFYEVWQRGPEQPATTRLPLGGAFAPGGVPRCAGVRKLASQGAGLAAATAAEPIVVRPAELSHPAEWEAERERGPVLFPRGSGSIVADVELQAPGSYEIWLGGSVRSEANVFVDGAPAGTVRHELNNQGGYVALGEASLRPGSHRIEVRFAGPDAHPGSGGSAPPAGPLALTMETAADARVIRVPRAGADRLCGRSWDWIEALDER